MSTTGSHVFDPGRRKPVLLPVATCDDGGTAQATHLGKLTKITIDRALPDSEDRCDGGRTQPGFGQLLGESATQVDAESQQLIAKPIMDIGLPGVTGLSWVYRSQSSWRLAGTRTAARFFP